MTPFPCGASRPPSAKFPGYADAKGVFAHYKTCPHPGCQERQRAKVEIGRKLAAGMKIRLTEGGS